MTIERPKQYSECVSCSGRKNQMLQLTKEHCEKVTGGNNFSLTPSLKHQVLHQQLGYPILKVLFFDWQIGGGPMD